MFSKGEPFLRYIAKTTYFIDKDVFATDSRLLYIIDGKGEFKTEGATYALTPGTLIYYPAYTPYHIRSSGGMLFYTLNFDFTSERSTLTTPAIPLSCSGDMPIKERPYVPKELEEVVHIPSAYELMHYVKAIYEEGMGDGVLAKEAKSALLKLLLINVVRAKEKTTSNLVTRIKKAVETDVKLNNSDVAALLGYHPYYVNDVFRKAEGISLHKYITKKRLIHAKELITATDTPLENIANTCGFSSASHLSMAVKAYYGITPSKMRKI